MTTTEPTRDELFADALPVIRWQSRRFHHLPPGVCADDLESVGRESLLEAYATYDAASGVTFRTHARTVARARMVDFLRSVRNARKNRREPIVPWPVCPDTGRPLALPDPKADDPAELVAAQESVAAVVAKYDLPDPKEVAVKVAALRAAVWSGVSTEDVAELVRAQVGRAKRGNTRAAELVLKLLGGGA